MPDPVFAHPRLAAIYDDRTGLEDAGFADVEIAPTRVCSVDDARELLEGAGVDVEVARAADGRLVSASIGATKP